MSITQSQEERAAVCELWGQQHIGALAQTHHNWQLLRAALEKQPIISVALIVKIVDQLRPHLEFLAVPATAPAKRANDSWNFLAGIGVMRDPHQTHAEKQSAEQAKADLSRTILKDIAVSRQRRDLKQRLSEARSIVIQSPGGRVNHGATNDAITAAVNRMKFEISTFNRNNPDQAIAVEEKS
jgi:hypothetical protein